MHEEPMLVEGIAIPSAGTLLQWIGNLADREWLETHERKAIDLAEIRKLTWMKACQAHAETPEQEQAAVALIAKIIAYMQARGSDPEKWRWNESTETITYLTNLTKVMGLKKKAIGQTDLTAPRIMAAFPMISAQIHMLRSQLKEQTSFATIVRCPTLMGVLPPLSPRSLYLISRAWYNKALQRWTLTSPASFKETSVWAQTQVRIMRSAHKMQCKSIFTHKELALLAANYFPGSYQVVLTQNHNAYWELTSAFRTFLEAETPTQLFDAVWPAETNTNQILFETYEEGKDVASVFKAREKKQATEQRGMQ